jgi:hypothetical protein
MINGLTTQKGSTGILFVAIHGKKTGESWFF